MTIRPAEVGDIGYASVRFDVEVTTPAGANVQLLAEDTNGVVHDVAQIGYWGPYSGFPIDKDYTATTDFTAIFSAPGEYTISFKLVDVENAGAVIAAGSVTVEVIAAEAPGQLVLEGAEEVTASDALVYYTVRWYGDNQDDLYAGLSGASFAWTMKLGDEVLEDELYEFDQIKAAGKVWEHPDGDSICVSISERYREAGTYTLTGILSHPSGWQQTVTKTVTVTPALPPVSSYAFDYSELADVVAGEDVESSITLKTEELGQAGYDAVKFEFESEGPGDVTFTAVDSNGQEHTFTNSGVWGPPGGFELPAEYEAETEWTLNFAVPGEYTISFKLVDVENAGAVIAAGSVTVEVIAAEAPGQLVLEGAEEVTASDALVYYTVRWYGDNQDDLYAGLSGASFAWTMKLGDEVLEDELYEFDQIKAAGKVWEHPDGDSICVSISERYREAGTYTLTGILSHPSGWQQTVTKTVTVTPALPPVSSYAFDYSELADVVAGEDVESSITLKTEELGQAGYDAVKFEFESEGPGDVTFTAVDSNGQEHTFTNSGVWGPPGGFELPAEYEAETEWTLNFAVPGEYIISFKLVDVENAGAVIAAGSVTVEVIAAEAPGQLVLEGAEEVTASDALVYYTVRWYGDNQDDLYAGLSGASFAWTMKLGDEVLEDELYDFDQIKAAGKVWEHPDGDSICVSISERYREAGTYTLTGILSHPSGWQQTVTKTVTVTPALPPVSSYAFDYSELADVVAGEDVESSITLKTEELGQAGYDAVKFEFESEGPGDVTFTAVDSNGQEHTFTNSGVWGPPGGFELPAEYEAETEWTLNFSAPGEYTISFKLVDVENAGTVIAAGSVTVEVIAAEAPGQLVLEGAEEVTASDALVYYTVRWYGDNQDDLYAGLSGASFAWTMKLGDEVLEDELYDFDQIKAAGKVWEHPDGDSICVSISERYREAGTYTLTGILSHPSGWQQTVTKTVTVTPALPPVSSYAFDYSELADVVAGEDVESSITLKTEELGQAGYDAVKFEFESEGPGDVTFTAVDSNGQEHTFTNSGVWGPPGGFELPAEYEAETEWTLNFAVPGEYIISFKLVDVENAGAVIAAGSVTVEVIAAEAPGQLVLEGAEEVTASDALVYYTVRWYGDNQDDLYAGLSGASFAWTMKLGDEVLEDELYDFDQIKAAGKVWEHPDGDSICVSISERYREAGTYTLTGILSHPSGWQQTVTKTVTVTPALPPVSSYAFDYSELADVVAGEDVESSITLKTEELGQAGYDAVKFEFESEGPGDVTFTAVDSNGQEHTFTNSGVWGPPGGFELPAEYEAETEWTLNFAVPGEYIISFKLVDVENAGTVIAAGSVTVEVIAAEAPGQLVLEGAEEVTASDALVYYTVRWYGDNQDDLYAGLSGASFAWTMKLGDEVLEDELYDFDQIKAAGKVWEHPDGDSICVSISERYREAGTYTLTGILSHPSGWQQTVTKTVTVTPALPPVSSYAFDYSELADVVAGEDVESSITLKTEELGQAGYDAVKFEFESEGPGDVTFTAVDSNGQEHTFTNSGVWGPPGGFELPAEYEAETEWTLNFAVPGEYIISFKLVDVENAGAVIAAGSVTVEVIAAEAPGQLVLEGAEEVTASDALVYYTVRWYGDNQDDLYAGLSGASFAWTMKLGDEVLEDELYDFDQIKAAGKVWEHPDGDSICVSISERYREAGTYTLTGILSHPSGWQQTVTKTVTVTLPPVELALTEPVVHDAEQKTIVYTFNEEFKLIREFDQPWEIKASDFEAENAGLFQIFILGDDYSYDYPDSMRGTVTDVAWDGNAKTLTLTYEGELEPGTYLVDTWGYTIASLDDVAIDAEANFPHAVFTVEADPVQEALEQLVADTSITVTYVDNGMEASFDDEIEVPDVIQGYKIDVLVTLDVELPEDARVTILYNGLETAAKAVQISGTEIWLSDLVLGGNPADFESGPAATWTVLISGNADQLTVNGTIESIISNDGFATQIVLAAAGFEFTVPDTTAPSLDGVTPAEGNVHLSFGESFVLSVDASDEHLYELEIDHNLEGVLPEFSVYADENNPYGSDDDKAAFEGCGVEVTYDADEQKWTIDFGQTVTEQFVTKGDVRFYIVLIDEAGNTWGSMYEVTPENTFAYNITQAEPVASTYEFVYSLPSEITAEESYQIPVTIRPAEVGDIGYASVRFDVEVTTPDGANVQLLAEDTNGVVHDVAQIGYWGPYSGFPIDKDYTATTDFTAIFSAPGEYTISFKLVDVENAGAVIAAGSVTVEVIAAEAPGQLVLEGAEEVTASDALVYYTVRWYGDNQDDLYAGLSGASFAWTMKLGDEVLEDELYDFDQIKAAGKVWEHPDGDSICVSISERYREAGTYTLTGILSHPSGWQQTVTKTVTVTLPPVELALTEPVVHDAEQKTIVYTFNEEFKLIREFDQPWEIKASDFEAENAGLFQIFILGDDYSYDYPDSMRGTVTDVAWDGNAKTLTLTYEGELEPGTYLVDTWGYTIASLDDVAIDAEANFPHAVFTVEADPVQEALEQLVADTSITVTYVDNGMEASFDDEIEVPDVIQGYKIDVLVTLDVELPEDARVTILYNGLETAAKAVQISGTEIWLSDLVLGGNPADLESGPAATWTVLISGNADQLTVNGTIESIISNDGFATQIVLAAAGFEFTVPDTAAPSLDGVTPAEGNVHLSFGESFVLSVDASDEHLYELEIDHNLEGVLPEFSVYADENNPYGSDDDKAAFEGCGVEVTYDADEQKWTIDFGQTVTEQFVTKGDVRFYIVLIDEAGNTWGSMYEVTPENTFAYNITQAEPVASTYEFVYSLPSEITAEESYQIPVTIRPAEVGDIGYASVRFDVEVTTPDGANVQLLAEDTNGVVHDVAQIGYWGPYSGFPIDKDYTATTDFTAIFSAPGEYTISFKLVDVENAGAVIAAGSVTVEVIAAEAPGQLVLEGAEEVTASDALVYYTVRWYGDNQDDLYAGLSGASFAWTMKLGDEVLEDELYDFDQIKAAGKVWEHPDGDSICVSISERYREAGTYTLTGILSHPSGWQQTVTKTVTVTLPPVELALTEPVVHDAEQKTIVYTFNEEFKLIREFDQPWEIKASDFEAENAGLFQIFILGDDYSYDYPDSMRGTVTDVAWDGNAKTLTLTYEGELEPGTYLVDTWGYTIASLDDVAIDAEANFPHAVFTVEADPVQEALEQLVADTSITVTYVDNGMEASFDDEIEVPDVIQGYKIDVLVTLDVELPEDARVTILYNGLETAAKAVQISGTEIWLSDLVLGGNPADFESGPAATWTVLISGNADQLTVNGTIESIISNDGFATQIVLAAAGFEFTVPDTAAPSLDGVTPAEGNVHLSFGESFVLSVDASDEHLYELEIDHNLEGVLPEFSVYADENNPYGSDDDKAAFEGCGVEVTYDADEQKWTIDFGQTVTEQFVTKGDVRFYIVLIDEAGNTWGSMYEVTPENTFAYNITQDEEYVTGSIAWDPGKTGGADVNVTVLDNTITFDGEIAWYPEDLGLGRAAGNRVGVEIIAPEGFDASAAVVTIGGNDYAFGDDRFFWYPLVSAAGQEFTATVVWNSASTQVFTVKVAGTATLEEEHVTGSIAWDPGKTGGADVNVTVLGNTITFDGEIAWYPEDLGLGRAAGNRVGVEIIAPEGFDASAAVVTIGGNDYPFGDDRFFWYPLVSAAGQEFTATVVWNSASTQVFTVKISDDANLAPAGIQRTVNSVTQDPGNTGGSEIDYSFDPTTNTLTISDGTVPYVEATGDGFPPSSGNWVGVAIKAPAGFSGDIAGLRIDGTEYTGDILSAEEQARGELWYYFKATAEDATHTLVIKWSDAYAEETIIVKTSGLTLEAESHSAYTLAIDVPEYLNVGEATAFTVTTSSDGNGNSSLTAIYEYTVTGGGGSLEYKDDHGTWQPLPLSGQFGPSGGFQLTPNYQATTELRFTPNETAEYSVSIILRTLGDAPAELCSATAEVITVGRNTARLTAIPTVIAGFKTYSAAVHGVNIPGAHTWTLEDRNNYKHLIDATGDEEYLTLENPEGQTTLYVFDALNLLIGKCILDTDQAYDRDSVALDTAMDPEACISVIKTETFGLTTFTVTVHGTNLVGATSWTLGDVTQEKLEIGSSQERSDGTTGDSTLLLVFDQFGLVLAEYEVTDSCEMAVVPLSTSVEPKAIITSIATIVPGVDWNTFTVTVHGTNLLNAANWTLVDPSWERLDFGEEHTWETKAESVSLFVFDHDGAIIGEYSIEVRDYTNELVELTPVVGDRYTLRLRVAAGDEPIDGALVEVSGQEPALTTGGMITFSLPAGQTYWYRVSKDGFSPVEASVVLDEDKEVHVDLTAVYAVTFTVKTATAGGEGEALAGATVEITLDGVSYQSLTTDSNGVVQFLLPSGEDYVFSVFKAGYVTVGEAFAVTDSSTSFTVTLNAAQYEVTFKVLDDNGEVVSGATIKIDGTEVGTTDAEGQLSLTLAHGTHQYQVSKAGYVTVVESFDVTDSSDNVNVTLTAAEYSIIFAVTDENGQAVSGAAVKIDGAEVGTTNAAGQLSLTLTHGTHNYEVNRAGYHPASGSFQIVAPGESVEVTLNAIPYSVIFRVTAADGESAIADATVEITVDGVVHHADRTDSNGLAKFTLTIGDSYAYTVSKEGYLSASRSFAVADDQEIHVKLNAEEADRYNVTFRVTAVHEDGEPIHDARVSILGQDEPLSTDEAGGAAIALPEGEYQYSVQAEGYLDSVGEFTVDADAHVSVIMVPLHGITFEVQVRDFAGPVAGVSILVYDVQTETLSAAMDSDEQGMARTELPNGSYRYTASHIDYDTAAGEFVVQGEALSVTVQLDEKTYPVKFEVWDGSERVRNAEVTVVSATGTSATGYTSSSGDAAVFQLSNGTYDYIVEAEGYFIQEGTISVFREGVDEQVELVRPTATITVSKQLIPLVGDEYIVTVHQTNVPGCAYFKVGDNVVPLDTSAPPYYSYASVVVSLYDGSGNLLATCELSDECIEEVVTLTLV
ncbi:MAG: PEGA domain-containing protein [Bacillota bacterium]